ncbi:phospholipid phosphatase 1-like isoform X2 [Mytilus edulis]|uniref:phospholipid phosphatase 1-like isoform X1 n=1 Tax=Mytilus edulis TaxID=6550 RepID=UPI0039F07560
MYFNIELVPLLPRTVKRIMCVDFFKGVVNSCIAFSLGLIILLINRLWEPFKRGFFCDDDSIKYPHHDSTIPSPVLYGVGFSFNILSFILIEAALLRNSKNSRTNKKPGQNIAQTYFCIVFNILLPFLYGAAVVQLVTDIAKYSVGRLRPHFLAVCQPDVTKFNCTDGYITADVCTGDMALIKHARVSFPSGHASFSMYSMLFLVFYYQARLTWKNLLLLRPLLQLIVFCLAFYTGLSRIYDYKHHWSDVLAGNIIGVIVSLITVFTLTDLFKGRKSSDEQQTDNNVKLESIRVNKPVTKL